MPTQPQPPAPRPRHRHERLFIWLFGAALLLLVGYRLAVYEPQPAAPPTPPAPAAAPAPPPRAAEPSTPRFTPPTPKTDGDRQAREDQDVATQTVQGNEMAAVDLSGLDDGRSEPAPEPVEDKVYTYVEQMPQPPGGLEGLMQYLHGRVKYPAQALREQVEGKVFVNFVVRPDGRLTDVKVIKGIGAGCDEEAVRVLRQMPAWAPGKQNGRVVSVSYTVPVTFAVK